MPAMRTCILLLLIGAGLLALAPARSQEEASPSPLEQLKEKYERALGRIEDTESEQLDELSRNYLGALDEGIQYFMARGELHPTLALREERERFAAQATMPTPPPPEKLDEKARNVFIHCRTRWTSIVTEADAKRLELARYYAGRLDALEKHLTQQGKLDQALAVNAEGQRVEKTLAEIAARMPKEATGRESPKPTEGTASRNFPPELRKRIVAYYPFDQPGEAACALGSGPNGRVRKAQWREDGKVGGCLEFDGKRSLVLFPAGSIAKLLDGADAISFALWLKPDSLPDLEPKNAPIVFALGNSPGGGAMVLVVSRERTVFGGSHGPGDSWVGVGTRGLAAGGWTFLAGTVDLAGKEIALYTHTKVTSAEHPKIKERRFRSSQQRGVEDVLGGSWVDPHRDFTGRMDELVLIKGAIASSDIEALTQRR